MQDIIDFWESTSPRGKLAIGCGLAVLLPTCIIVPLLFALGVIGARQLPEAEEALLSQTEQAFEELAQTVSAPTHTPPPTYTLYPTYTPVPSPQAVAQIEATATQEPVSVVPTMAPLASQEPTAPPQPAPAGPGISRANIQSMLESSERGFEFDLVADISGQPHIVGKAEDNSAVVELIGSAENLLSASITVPLPDDTPEAITGNIEYMLALLDAIAPDWEGKSDWLITNLSAAEQGEVKTTHDNLQISLQKFKEFGVATLAIDVQSTPVPPTLTSPPPTATTGPTNTVALTATFTPASTATLTPEPTTTPPPEPTATPEPTVTLSPTLMPISTATVAPTTTLAPTATPTTAGIPTNATRAQLAAVIDGDTIDVLLNGRVERVRYIGIDAPDRFQPGYQAAMEANRRLLAPGTIYLVRDQSERDGVGRLLRYVYTADNTFVNRQMIAQGWAQPLENPPDTSHAAEFRRLAVTAAKAIRGFWRGSSDYDGAMSYGLTIMAVNLRDGPGVEFEVSSWMPAETTFTIFGRNTAGDWLQIRAPDGNGGWVYAPLVWVNVPIAPIPITE